MGIEFLKTVSSLWSLGDRLAGSTRRLRRSGLLKRWIQAIVIFWGVLSVFVSAATLYLTLIAHSLLPIEGVIILAAMLGFQGLPVALLGGEIGRLRAERNAGYMLLAEERRAQAEGQNRLDAAQRALAEEAARCARFLSFVDTKLRDWVNMVIPDPAGRSSGIDLRELYLWVEDVLSEACELVGPDRLERACIYRPTADGGRLRIWAGVGLKVDCYERNVFSLKRNAPYMAQGTATWVYRNRQPRVMDCWWEDPDYARLRSADDPPPYSGSLLVPILAPVAGGDVRCVAVLCIDKAVPEDFCERDVPTAVAVSRFLVSAMMTFDQQQPGWCGERWG